MFTTLIVQPIFNLLVIIYSLLPGHNFGLAIIIFTIIIRLLMWPLVKRQLHQAKAMRELQPEIKRIKAESKGNRQKESLLLMELYKERKINPFASFGLVLLQIPIFIGLYSSIKRIITDPHVLVTFSYPFVQSFHWLQTLANDISKFDATLFGIVDLTKPALSNGAIYWPAMILVLSSVVIQYYQSKQLLPSPKESKGLKNILKEASSGKQADQSEINAAVGRSTRYFLPAMIFLITVHIASALSLYWLVSGIVAYIQQARVLGRDEQEMEAVADKPNKSTQVIEGEIVDKSKSKPANSAQTKNKKSKAKKKAKRKGRR